MTRRREAWLMSLFVSMAFVSFAGTPGCIPPEDPETEEPHIPDLALEEAIRLEIGKPTGDLTLSDMESLTFLNAGDMGITDLTGLEYAVNLRNLYLNLNPDISNIVSLEALTSLVEVKLGDNGDVEWTIQPLINNPGFNNPEAGEEDAIVYSAGFCGSIDRNKHICYGGGEILCNRGVDVYVNHVQCYNVHPYPWEFCRLHWACNRE